MPKVKNTCVSKEKGKKFEVAEASLEAGLGIKGDFHAKGGERQVSLLAEESIQKMREKGLKLEPGAFGENIVTEGIELTSLAIGQKIKVGETELEISKIGKECPERCQIYYQTGDCIMPREGVFARVLKGGIIKSGDEILRSYEERRRMRVGIITISDKGAKGEREDLSGPAIKEIVAADSYEDAIVPDEPKEISAKIMEFVDKKSCNLVLTTGGTGLSPRDVTPEATRAVIDREIPGIAEAIRFESYKIKDRAMLSRAIAGSRGKSLIINLPGSPKAVKECLRIVLPVIPHALEVLEKGSVECG